jgi:hypothetical protein
MTTTPSTTRLDSVWDVAAEIASERFPSGTTNLDALAECVREAQRRLGLRPPVSEGEKL